MQLILPATGVVAAVMSVIVATAVDVVVTVVNVVAVVAMVRSTVIFAVACQGSEAADAFGELR